MNFFRKPATEFGAQFTGTYSKPATCPDCGIGTDGVPNQLNYLTLDNNTYLFIATCSCTFCEKIFFYACYRNRDQSDNASMVCIYPNVDSTYSNNVLQNISPRFIDMYNQALRSEANEDFELAAIGYRSSLEILIKDFAIAELREPKDDVVKQSLFNAIKKYLKRKDFVNTADVIRILGNDYTHYDKKYPEHDFVILKGYMDIFLSQIETQYKINHPPVART